MKVGVVEAEVEVLEEEDFVVEEAAAFAVEIAFVDDESIELGLVDDEVEVTVLL